ncbi:MAG: methyltransferase [Patescibacteria group bacterium]
METSGVDNLTNKIHHTLAHSYFIYLFFLVLGIALDLLFPMRIIKNPLSVGLGIFLLVIATIIIFWAQRTTRNLHSGDTLTKEAFLCGPYCYTRTPTHWGLFILTLGFGFIANAFFVVLSTLISFFVTKFVFLRKYEEILEEKYGDAYRDYEKAVKL